MKKAIKDILEGLMIGCWIAELINVGPTPASCTAALISLLLLFFDD